MIRLLLVFAPAACISGAIGVSWILENCAQSIKAVGWGIVDKVKSISNLADKGQS